MDYGTLSILRERNPAWRLLTLFSLLEQISAGTETDAAKRVKEQLALPTIDRSRAAAA